MAGRVRTRLDRATFTVTCLDHEIHQFTMSLDGTVTNPHHDADDDAVILALGGSPHPCGVARLAFDAARFAHEARLGVHDVPKLRYRNGRWGDGHNCGTGCGNTPSHISGVDHQASRLGTDKRMARILHGWMRRRSPVTMNIREFNAAEEAEFDAIVTPVMLHSWYLKQFRRMGVTPEYARAAMKVVNPAVREDENLGHFITMFRANGLTLDWLRTFAAHVNEDALERHYGQGYSPRFLPALYRARNVNPAKVAEFVNAGIVSHYYTYVKAGATPEQVLRVYRATNSQTTLADLITHQGLTIPQALATVA